MMDKEEIKSNIKRYERILEEWVDKYRLLKFNLIEADREIMFYKDLLSDFEVKLKELEK